MRLGRFGSLVAAALFTAHQAAAQDVTFVVHHFLAPVANAHKAMIVPWTEKVTAESGGRIAFEIFPAMSLGGKPAELYGQVRDGTADIVLAAAARDPRDRRAGGRPADVRGPRRGDRVRAVRRGLDFQR